MGIKKNFKKKIKKKKKKRKRKRKSRRIHQSSITEIPLTYTLFSSLSLIPLMLLQHLLLPRVRVHKTDSL